jgi:hypothetical protein
MVRAIREGRKTQTRRIIRGSGDWQAYVDGLGNPEFCEADQDFCWFDSGTPVSSLKCPYGVPSDRLWVRESFQPLYADGYNDQTANWETGEGYAPNYSADGRLVDYVDADGNVIDKCTPSIHAPRWSSRITLEIKSVRVERLIEISEEDAMAEGVVYRDSCWFATDDSKALPWMTASGAYRELWESINGPGSWDANPWVWVIQFRRVQ